VGLSEISETLGLKQKAYRATFGPPGTAAHEAFLDLAKFCHAFGNEIAEGNHDRTLRFAGRREAFFHIWEYLNLSHDELLAIYPRIKINAGE
jgi:hypothetical protein